MKTIKQYAWLILLLFSIGGIIYPPVGIVAIICMLAPVVTAPFMGRRWCGTFCPRGSLNDVILKKITLKKGIPALFKTNKFKIGFLIILMSLFAVQLWMAWGNIAAIGSVFVRMILITTIVDIILGVVYHQRTWCSFCPMGSMAGWIAQAKHSISKSFNNNHSQKLSRT